MIKINLSPTPKSEIIPFERDHFLSPSQALEFGLIDEVVEKRPPEPSADAAS